MSRLSYALALSNLLAKTNPGKCTAFGCQTEVDYEAFGVGRVRILSPPEIIPSRERLESLFRLFHCGMHQAQGTANESLRKHLNRWISEIAELREAVPDEHKLSLPEPMVVEPPARKATASTPRSASIAEQRRHSGQSARSSTSRFESPSSGLITPPTSPPEIDRRLSDSTVQPASPFSRSRRASRQDDSEAEQRWDTYATLERLTPQTTPTRISRSALSSNFGLRLAAAIQEESTIIESDEENSQDGELGSDEEDSQSEESDQDEDNLRNSDSDPDEEDLIRIYHSKIDEKIIQIASSNLKVLTEKDRRGYLYAMKDETHLGHVYKVGSSCEPQKRLKQMIGQCPQVKLTLTRRQCERMARYKRAEKLAHVFMSEFRHPGICACGSTTHHGRTEYFELELDLIQDIIALTTSLVRPAYRKNGTLVRFWKDAFDKFEACGPENETLRGRIKRWSDWLKKKQTERDLKRAPCPIPSVSVDSPASLIEEAGERGTEQVKNALVMVNVAAAFVYWGTGSWTPMKFVLILTGLWMIMARLWDLTNGVLVKLKSKLESIFQAVVAPLSQRDEGQQSSAAKVTR